MRQDSNGKTAWAVWRAVLAGVVLAGGAALAAPQAAHAVDTGATEGNTMEFTITLGAAPNGWAVRYKYKTKDGAAVEGEDYDEATGTVTFNSGVKQQKVYVDTIDDSEEEDPEVFKLKLYDQEVNGLYRDVTGWVTPTSNIRSMPSTMTLKGQIQDNDQAVKAGCGNAGQYCD